jgi:hypothetical protein
MLTLLRATARAQALTGERNNTPAKVRVLDSNDRHREWGVRDILI